MIRKIFDIKYQLKYRKLIVLPLYRFFLFEKNKLVFILKIFLNVKSQKILNTLGFMKTTGIY